MTSLTRSLLVVGAIAWQPSHLGVITLGETDVIAQLSDTDIAVIKERVRDTCARLWLVRAFRSQLADSQYVEAYCAASGPQNPQVPVRRGVVVGLRQRPAGPWKVVSKQDYAQVIDDATATGRLPAGDRDIHRPFRVTGNLSDADLVSLVAFVRSSPPNPKPDRFQPRVEGSWPIAVVWDRQGGIAEVGLAKDDMSSQRVQLRRTERGWEIVSVNFVVV